MNYEQKYKEALEQARQAVLNIPDEALLKWLQAIFPELKESEDERIRKELLSFVQRLIDCHDKPDAERDEQYISWIAWLEKQKSVEWSQEDDAMYFSCHCALGTANYYSPKDKDALKDWVTSLKQRITK